MAGYGRLKELIDESYNSGKHWYVVWRKTPSIATTLGVWFDLSIAPGTPRPNYWLGDALTAKRLNGDYGIYHGPSVTTDGFKFLHKFMLGAASANVIPGTFLLCDYLLYYPLIDMDTTDTQVFDNTITIPRYTDGEGVKAFLVATNPYLGGAQFRITYTNQAGAQGQVSEWHTTNATTNIGTVINSGVGASLRSAFIQLQIGDRGIRSVQSIDFASSNGGLAVLVLCRPLATICTKDVQTVAETDFLFEIPSLPKIYDGAFLSLLGCPAGSASGIPIFGELSTIWR